MLTEIRTRLDDLLDHDDGVTGETVKSTLCLACRHLDPTLYTCATGVDEDAADQTEWLYDVTCLKYDDDGYLTRVVLAAECEWGPENAIYYDFEKLLLVRADLRVMIFDGHRQPGYEALFAVFAQYIGRCTQTEIGDEWLFAAWTEDRFIYHRHAAFNAQGALD